MNGASQIKNKLFQEHLGMTSVGNKIIEAFLKWFGHIQCMPAQYTGWWPTKKKEQDKEDVDKDNKNRYYEVQLV